MIKENRIEDMIRQIDELPKGYITKKKIKGSTYYYHQWEDGSGRMHYDSIPEAEAAVMRERIEQRKALQKTLKKLQKQSGADETERMGINFSCNVLYGGDLKEMISIAEGFDKRDCYHQIEEYIYGKQSDKVCLLYGLRRTGKTTMLRQLISGMEPDIFNRSAYIKTTQLDTMADMNHDLKELRRLGFKFVFVDEVTLMSDFIDSASLFSDVYAAAGMKIVLSGTDSLGFYFASNEELYDRAVIIHTTFIPYREHARLLKIDSVDEYIRYGGTLKAGELDFENDELNVEEASFRDDEAARRYIDTAICKNIQHSLKCYEDGGHFRHLKELYDASELTNVINRIIQDMNHDFTIDVILREFKSRDLRSAAQLLRTTRDEQERTDALDEIDTREIIQKLKKILDIREKEELTKEISEVVLYETEEYLKALDLIQEIDMESTAPGSGSVKRIVFTQPGMRFCQAEALVYSLMKSDEFHNLSEREKSLITHKILDDVRGIMLEDIVLLETVRSLPKWKRAFKLQFSVGEFDMVIYDSRTDTCEAYEIKHSRERSDSQWKNLIKDENIIAAEKRYGSITKKIVLYSGVTGVTEGGLEYKNVEEYLKELS